MIPHSLAPSRADQYNERVGLHRFEHGAKVVEACLFLNKTFVRRENPNRRPTEKLTEHPDLHTAREAWGRLVRKLIADGFVEVEPEGPAFRTTVVVTGPDPESRQVLRAEGADIFRTYGSEPEPSAPQLRLWSHEAAVARIEKIVAENMRAGGYTCQSTTEPIAQPPKQPRKRESTPQQVLETVPASDEAGRQLAQGLAEQGDERGVLALAVLSNQAIEGPRGRVFRGFGELFGESLALDFRHGFPFHAAFEYRHLDEPSLAELITGLCALPGAQTIRSVTIGRALKPTAEHSLSSALKALIKSPLAPTLQALRLEPLDSQARVLPAGDLSSLWKGLPSLEKLSLLLTGWSPSKLGQIKHAHLRSIELKTHWRTDALALTTMALPSLTTLRLTINRGEDDEPSLDDIDRLLKRAGKSPLEDVTLEGWFVPHVLQVLPAHAWVGRLKRLRLIADDGMGLPMKMPALENALPILKRIASVEVRDDALREPLWTNAAPPASHSHRFRRPQADE